MFPLKLSENHKFTDDFRGLSHFSLRNTSVIRQKGESQNLRVHISGYKMFVFRNIWRALFSWNTRFEICLFALLPTIFAFICSVKWKEKILNTYTLVQSAMIINFSGNFLVLFFYSNFVKWNIALMEKFKLTNKDENYSTIFI